MNIVFIASIVNSYAGGRTFLLYGDKGFAIDPQIITPFRYVPYRTNYRMIPFLVAGQYFPYLILDLQEGTEQGS